MKTHALLTDLTEQEEETLSGGYWTNASAYLAALTAWQRRNSAQIQQRLANRWRRPGGRYDVGAVNRRTNAILANLRRYW